MKTEKRVTISPDAKFEFLTGCDVCELEISDDFDRLWCYLTWDYTDSKTERPDWCPLEVMEVVLDDE